MQGILLIDKPKGWTSFDVVAKVRGIMRAETGIKRFKVGHTGTLDPLATGLLVILVGKEYTKRAPGLTKLDKTYEVTMKLGQTSTTADDEGEKIAVSDTVPTKETVKAALQQFTGDIMQVPPAFSAMKINGQRAYKLARAGKEVIIEPRPARIYKNELTSYEYPYVKFISEVGSGTYIRSLVVDLGKVLETGAYMADLRRTKVGDFTIENAISLENISPTAIHTALLTE